MRKQQLEVKSPFKHDYIVSFNTRYRVSRHFIWRARDDGIDDACARIERHAGEMMPMIVSTASNISDGHIFADDIFRSSGDDAKSPLTAD